MRILACLLDCFQAEYEPKGIPEMGTSRPEFLLKSPDGNILFEITSVSTKPEDVREGVKVSTGETLKKALQNKVARNSANARMSSPSPLS